MYFEFDDVIDKNYVSYFTQGKLPSNMFKMFGYNER